MSPASLTWLGHSTVLLELDGTRVVVWHGSAGLHCYDYDGQKLWSRDLGEFKHIWGYGSSPVFYGDKIILNCGPGVRTFVTAIDAALNQPGKTIVVINMGPLLRKNGVLERLTARHITIEAPAE